MCFDLEKHIVESICAIAKKYYITKIVLFGSRARGDNRSRSDIDLAVYPDGNLEDKGLMGINSPKSVLKEAFSAGIITDEKLWINMLLDRNATSHMYSESTALEICRNIKDKYASALEELRDRIVKRIGYIDEAGTLLP